jgi:hypothetical protein
MSCCYKTLENDGVRENYDPNAPVCQNQADFNQALRKAVQYNQDQDVKSVSYVYIILWSVFFIWAVLLALKVKPHSERVLHLVLAMLFSPVYVLSHYLGGLNAPSSAVMGMCGRE